MELTIKQLADRLGVSKTAIRKHMSPEIRAEHTDTDPNGVIIIDSEGCKLIAESLGKLPELAECKVESIPETTENTENVTIPRSVLALLEGQLAEKDRQIAEKDKHIAELTTALHAAQALHAGDMKRLGDGKRRGLRAWFNKGE